MIVVRHLVLSFTLLLLAAFGVSAAFAAQGNLPNVSYAIAAKEFDTQAVNLAFSVRAPPAISVSLANTGTAFARTGNVRVLDGVKTSGAVYASLRSSNAPKGGALRVTAANPSASELRAAEHMADVGRNVELRDPVGTRAGGGTSDLLVDGVPYDVYTPTSANPNRIISAIAKKNDQATGIVVDLSSSPVTREQLGDVLARVNGAGATNITDIVIIGK